MPNTQLSAELLASAAHALTGLQESLSVSLQLLVFTNAWHALNDSPKSSDAAGWNRSRDFSILPAPSLQTPQPFLVAVTAGRHVIGFHVQTTPQSVVYAVGESAFSLETLLQTVAQQSAQIQKLREDQDFGATQLDNFADQVLHDFEERSWLLKLTEHLRLCEISRSLNDVAHGLLPHLKDILCARSVAFVPEQLPGINRNSTCGLIGLHGEDNIKDFPLLEIVRRFRRNAISQTVVRNWSTDTNEEDRIPGIDSLMVAPISRDTVVVGWLLAINRNMDANVPIRVTSNADDPNFTDHGFGTAEAGLLKSAAIVLATHDHNLQMLQENQSLTVGVVRSLANAVDARDKYTHGHSDRVARMARHLARRNGADPQVSEQILMTGLVHDIGKIGVPDHVLLKPGRLTDEEYAIIKEHPVIGHGILHHIKELSYTLDGVLYHHEAWNGSGYPAGLKGTDIPLFGRILAIVDAYDAMTSNRPYRKGMPFLKAEAIIREGAGVQWDPELVEIFLLHFEEFRNICRESPDHCLSLEELDPDVLPTFNESHHLLAIPEFSEPVLAN